MHYIQRFVLQQFLVICVYVCIFNPVLLGCLSRALLDDITECYQFYFFTKSGKCREMLLIGDPAAADESESQFFAHVSFLLNEFRKYLPKLNYYLFFNHLLLVNFLFLPYHFIIYLASRYFQLAGSAFNKQKKLRHPRLLFRDAAYRVHYYSFI